MSQFFISIAQIVLIIFLYLNQGLLCAQTAVVKKAEENEKEMIPISWQNPLYSVAKKKNDNVFSLKIIVSGKTKPGVKVRLATSAQWIIEKEIQSIEVNNLRYNNSKMVEQNEDGGFTLTLEVPTNGTLHLPIYLIEDQHHQSQLLVLKMDEERLFQKNEIYNRCWKCLWFGVGVGFINYKQDPPENLKAVDYGSITLPNFSLRGQYLLNPKWALRGDYHRQSGDDLASTSSSVTISNTNVVWSHMGVEAEYLAFNTKNWWGIEFDPSWLLGIQYQDMPFVRATVSPNYTIDSFKFASLSLGALAMINPTRRWQFETFVRFQLALAGAGDVKLSSGFSFDGSVGVLYHWMKNWKWGAFWNGQYHSYKYKLSGSEGSYSLLSSKVDLTLGYQF